MVRRDVRVTVGVASKVLLWIVYAWLVVDVVLLFIAFLLQLLGANPDASFVDWVYRSIERAMAPFRGIFQPITLSDQSVLDTSLLFAMIVYGIVALFLRAGIDWVTAHLEGRRRQLEREEWIARTEAPPTSAAMPSEPAPAAPGAGRYAGSAVVPAQPTASRLPSDPPPGT